MRALGKCPISLIGRSEAMGIVGSSSFESLLCMGKACHWWDSSGKYDDCLVKVFLETSIEMNTPVTLTSTLEGKDLSEEIEKGIENYYRNHPTETTILGGK